MYYCLILYSYTHCTFQQISQHSICLKRHNPCYFQQIDTFPQHFKPFPETPSTLKVIID